MPDIGFNYQTGLNFNYENYQTEQTTEKPQVQGTVFADKTQSLGGVWGQTPYTANINSPKLADILYGLSNTPPGLHQKPEATPTHAYYDAFSEEIQNLIDQNNLSEEQANQLVEAHFLKTPLEDPFLKGILSQLHQAIAENLVQLFDLPPLGDQSSNVAKKGNDFINATKREIQELRNYIKTLPEGSEKQQLMQKLSQMESSLQSFQSTLSTAQNSSDRAALDANTNALNQIVKQIEKQLEELSQIGGKNAHLGAVLSSFQETVGQRTADLKSTFSEIALSYQISQGDYSGITESMRETYIGLLSKDYKSAFSGALQNPSAQFALTDKEQALLKQSQKQLEFIFNHRESLNDFGPEVAALFHKINSGILQSMALPPGYEPPVDNTEFMTALTESAENLFEQTLDNYVAKNGLSSEQATQLKNIYFGVTPGSLPPALEAEIQAAMISQLGIPEGFPVPKGVFHTLNIQGQFLQQIMTLINSLPPEQKQAVLAALTNPLSGSVTPEIRALIQKLFNEAASSIRQQFSLPDDWHPPVTLLGEVTQIPPRFQQLNTTLNGFGEQINLMVKVAQSWPDSPNKAMFLNVLKIVSDALSHLKAQVAVMQMIDARVGIAVAKAQLDAALTKAEESIEKMEEIREKMKKMASLGPLMKVLKYIFVALLCTFGAGPYLFAVMIAGEINGKDYIKEAFVAIQKVVSDLCSQILPKPLANLISMAAQIALMLALVIAAGPLLGLYIFFEHSMIFDTLFTKICGLKPMVAEIINMALMIAIEIVALVVLVMVTGGAGGALLGAKISARMAQMNARLTAKIVQGVVAAAEMVAQLADKCEKMGRIMQAVGKALRYVAQCLDDVVVNLVKHQSNLEKYADDMLKVADVMSPHLKNVKFSQQVKSVFAETGNHELDICIKIIDKEVSLLRAFLTTLGIGISFIQGAALFVNVNNNIVQAEIARIRGILESMIAELEAQIQVLKKFLQRIMDALEGMATWMGDIYSVQTQYWAGQSEALDAIANANTA